MWPQNFEKLVFKLPGLFWVWMQRGNWGLFIVWLPPPVIGGEGVMWLKLTASSLRLAHGLMPWRLSWSLQPPLWHPKAAAVPGQGVWGDARTLLDSPCLVSPLLDI